MSLEFLTTAELERLISYPKEISEWDLGRFFTLTGGDLKAVERQRGDNNRLGFALQLCTLRYLGFIPDTFPGPTDAVVRLLALQLGVSGNAIDGYGQREQTLSDHLSQAMTHLGYRRSSVIDMTELEDWLSERALEHDQPAFLLRTAAEKMRWNCILRPGLTSLTRLVSAARERARQATFELVSPILSPTVKQFLDSLLELKDDSPRTTLTWLQQMPNAHTSTQIIVTLEKIQFLQGTGIPDWNLSTINPNRLKFLANIGARATNQQLQRTSEKRRYPILIAFLKQSYLEFADVVVDLFDACLWECHNDAKRELDEKRLKAARSTNETLRTYGEIAKIIINDQIPDVSVRKQVFTQFNTDRLRQVIKETEDLIRPSNDEAVDLFANRYSHIRRFSPKFLAAFTFQSHRKPDPLLEAINILKELDVSGCRAVPEDAPIDFLSDAWRDYVIGQNGRIDRRYYELAVLWELRRALRSGDVFSGHGRRYADPGSYLIPPEKWPALRPEVARLTMTPLSGEIRLQEREHELKNLAKRVEALHADKDSWLRQESGRWVLTAFEGKERPESADLLEKAITERLPRINITDLIIEVDQWTGFSRHFQHQSPETITPDEIDLKCIYAVILSQGGNFDISQISRSSGLPYHHLVYTSTWFLRDETLRKANKALVDYHYGLDISQLWGSGTLSSSDGQRFPVSGKSRKARSNPRYFGYRRGVTFYTWVGDQFSIYGGKVIASTVRDATYVLDEILANETELPILEHTTDTSGYTEIVFALFDLLGLTFIPRIKDLPDQQLYRTSTVALDDQPLVRERLSKQINSSLFLDMWDEMLRLTGSLKLGWVTASLVIQKLQASSQKSKLAKALQEYGRLIKTLHILSWYESEEKRRWANRQLNKGEAIHSLKAFLTVGNRGILKRKTDEDLQHQVGSLNLLTNAIILWNTVYMGEVLKQLQQEGREINHEDLKHIWPTRFEHINIHGKYEFNVQEEAKREGLRQLRKPDDLNP